MKSLRKSLTEKYLMVFITIIFSHSMWFQNRDAVCFPIGKLTRYLRQPPRVTHELTPDGVRVLETLPPSFKPISIPADVPPLDEYR